METENIIISKNKNRTSSDTVDLELINKFQRGLEDLKKGNLKRVR